MFTYIAQPYSHPLDWVREARFDIGRHYCAYFVKKFKRPHFAPIAQGHSYAGMVPELSHFEWLLLDAPLLMLSNEIHILEMPGYQRSRGLAWELRMASIHNMHQEYITWAHLQQILPRRCRSTFVELEKREEIDQAEHSRTNSVVREADMHPPSMGDNS